MEALFSMALVDDLAISGHAYYAGEHAAGLRACERILASDAAPEIEARARRNRTWYTTTLQGLLGQATIVRLHVPPARPGWSVFNPSVCTASDGGLLCVVRSSNYWIDHRGHYLSPPEDVGKIRTRNIVVRLALDPWSVSPAQELIGPGYDQAEGAAIEGMEDLRLYCRGDEWRVSGTVLDAAGFDSACMIATARLLPDCGILCDFRLLPSPISGRHEKNWMPVVGHGREEWVYACWEDGAVATVRESCGAWKIGRCGQAPTVAKGFRGGSQLIPWLSGQMLCVVHEVAVDRGRRIYEHRFVRMDPTLTITGISDPFVFESTRSIEFCAGAAITKMADGRNVLALSYGANDQTAHVAICDPLLVDRAIREV